MKTSELINNSSMLLDFYEMTMSNGYFLSGLKDQIVYFEMFFRKIPDKGGFAVTCGLEQVIEHIRSLYFSEDDIAYLASLNKFDDRFLEYLRDLKFTCDVWAIPEGTPIFPNEPLVIVRGPIIEAQLIETIVLLCINHQSLISTKASRIVQSANSGSDGQIRTVMEFGTRRAHGTASAVFGARAAYISGCTGTACTLAGQLYDVPVLGTMAHSWVQLFENEYESFKAYASLYPASCSLLVDTYDVLKSGIPNAIKVFDEILKPAGQRPLGIRIDSGDITYLSKKARKMLDAAGYPDCKIIASNSLDEYIIRDMLLQGAKVDSFGVGERLITSESEPVFGGVYKLMAIEDSNGNIIPKIKVSENVSKITTPHFKKLYRLFNREDNMAIADLICVNDEVLDDAAPYELFDPDHTWKRKTVDNFYAKELLVHIFDKGKLVYTTPHIDEIRNYASLELSHIWDEVKRFENPHSYYVDLSQQLWDVKRKLLTENGVCNSLKNTL